MALPDWLVISGLSGAIIGPIISALKVKPDSRKMNRDGTAVLMTSTGVLISSVQEEMTDLRAEVRSLREWRTRVERDGRAHARWDDVVVTKLSAAGIDIPEPPPIFGPDSGGVS